MKPPKDRQLAKPGAPDQVDPKVAQLAHDEIVQLLTEGLNRGVFHNGVLLEDLVVVGGTEVRRFHGLGRVPRIATVVKASGTWITAFVASTPEDDPRNYIRLTPSGSGTISVLVA